MDKVKLIMPSTIAEYGNQLKGDGSVSDEVFIPLDIFNGDKGGDAYEETGVNATGTNFKVGLTHRFTKQSSDDGEDYIFDTIDLGQTGAIGKKVGEETTTTTITGELV